MNIHEINKLWLLRRIPVLIDGNVDSSLFHVANLSRINVDDLRMSALDIIRCATVHYMSRHKNPFFRWLNAFVEIVSAIGEYRDGRLYLNDNEYSEFQAKTSEVIAVGISIELSTRLFDVNRNRISPIFISGKRCDFSFTKNNLEYILESKGRKHAKDLNSAANDVIEKKRRYGSNSPKYGFLSLLPRDGTNSTIRVIDPEFIPRQVSQAQSLRNVLRHYLVIARLCGMQNFEERVNQCIGIIDSANTISSLKFPKGEIDLTGVVFQKIRGSRYWYSSKLQGFLQSFLNLNNIIVPAGDFYFHFAVSVELLKLLYSEDVIDVLTFVGDTIYDHSTSSLGNDGSALIAEKKNNP